VADVSGLSLKLSEDSDLERNCTLSPLGHLVEVESNGHLIGTTKLLYQIQTDEWWDHKLNVLYLKANPDKLIPLYASVFTAMHLIHCVVPKYHVKILC
jgi:hypothetical protein